MIALFLSIALAQSAPTYRPNSTCEDMLTALTLKHNERIVKASKMNERCIKQRAKLPDDLKSTMLCMYDLNYNYVPTDGRRFLNECSKILATNPLVLEELYKPFRDDK